MATIRSESFASTIATALERMAFVITEPSPETPGEVLAIAEYHSLIELDSEHHEAFVVLSASPGFLQEVAAGMLGLDPSEVDASEHGEAVIKELANILGGEVIMALGGAQSPYRLGLPEMIDDATTNARMDTVEEAGGFAVVLASETGRLLVAGHVRGEVA